MPSLPFGLATYSRANDRLPAVRLVNLYAEVAPTAETGTALLQRPGLNLEYGLGAAIRGLFSVDGVFGGAIMAVAGDKLFNGEIEVGGTPGIDRVEWAYTVDGLFVLSGGVVYQTDDGLTVAPTEFPDDAPVASITSINNFLVAAREGTGQVYFRIPGDTTWNALDFFSAEREPDPVLAVRALTDVLYVIGTSSIEPFVLTGDAENPLSRLDGSGADRGTKDRDSVVRMDNTLIFVGENSIVYRMEGVPRQISYSGIEDRIEASTTCSAWTYSVAGHSFYVLDLDTETVAYDASTQQWHSVAWPARLGVHESAIAYVAAGTEVHTLRDRPDDNGAEIERVFTALAPTEAPGSCHCIEVGLSPGTTPLAVTPATLKMRWSDNQSRTFTDWKPQTIGAAGEYRRRVRWRRLGIIDAPGRVFEFRITDPVSVRFSAVNLNPPNGGRARG